jgi:hypothetical protein
MCMNVWFQCLFIWSLKCDYILKLNVSIFTCYAYMLCVWIECNMNVCIFK